MAVETFEFIDCATISIAYQATGLASVSFVVNSSSITLENDYTNLTFGGVSFRGYVIEYKPQQVEGAGAFEHSFSLVCVGC